MFRKVFKIFDDLSSLNCSSYYSSDIALEHDVRGSAVNELRILANEEKFQMREINAS